MKQHLRIILIFYSLFTFIGASNASSQQSTISLKMQNVTVQEVLMEIRARQNISIVFNEEHLKNCKPISVDFKNESLEDAIGICLKGTGLDYNIADDDVVVISLERQQEIKTGQKRTIKGKVVDENGDPIPGVNIVFMTEGSDSFVVGSVTNMDGNYVIFVPSQKGSLKFTFIGLKENMQKIGDREVINVTLVADQNKVSEVVVTGLYERDRESFTGSVATVSGDELMEIGNSNVLESLNSLDPSFVIVENNLAGADPNVMPTIELRGKTSISTDDLRDEFGGDPNQPLFILDGFETSLRTIVDLDMNRVASITILKDAASTALYGAKAANGVIVVETKRPLPGELRLMYSGDFKVEVPDLRDYNMMNAEEKIQFEYLAGHYSDNKHNMNELDLYNARLAEIKRGVNNYWLSEPLQIGFTQGHTLYASGGDDALRYGASVNYKDQKGIMIGSGRSSWSGNVDLSYRKGKINITNKLGIFGYEANDSPYAPFSNFVQANPYFKKYNEEGKVERYLDVFRAVGFGVMEAENPIYNAQLDFRDRDSGHSIVNNTRINWNILRALRLQGNVQLSKSNTGTERFRSPQHTSYGETNVFEKGRYENVSSNSFGYRMNVMLTYATIIKEKHRLTSNVRAQIEENRSGSKGFIAVGFPAGSSINPIFSYGYQPNSKPSSSVRLYRRNNLLASANYSYDQRYMWDFTYRIDGSTTFGSNNLYSPFWATGIGWNVHNESFMKQLGWFDQLRLRSSMGITGNQSFGNITSISVYRYSNTNNIFGTGVNMSNLGNPDLEWQTTFQKGIGLDVSVYKRIKLSLDYYDKFSDPLIVKVDLPLSTGVYNYARNIGHLTTRGFETRLSVTPIKNTIKKITWTIDMMGSTIKSTYGGFDNNLESLNDKQLENRSLVRFKDGYSPDAIWAVKSVGIDPASGREVFERLDGQYTFTYHANEVQVAGNTRPKYEGTVSNRLYYKSFSCGVTFRYRMGGHVFNQALYQKVENISRQQLSYNQDARALHDRWKEPGDVAAFKGISLTESTSMSSRFVQKDNQWIGESFNVGLHLRKNSFIESIGMRELRITAYMNNLFRLSTTKSERGIYYPFANSVSLKINAKF